MRALVMGLPPEAAVWRGEQFPPVEELLALLLERSDEWSRAQLGFAAGKRVSVPGPVRIARPGQEVKPERKVERDPRQIAAWLAKLN